MSLIDKKNINYLSAVEQFFYPFSKNLDKSFLTN